MEEIILEAANGSEEWYTKLPPSPHCYLQFEWLMQTLSVELFATRVWVVYTVLLRTGWKELPSMIKPETLQNISSLRHDKASNLAKYFIFRQRNYIVGQGNAKSKRRPQVSWCLGIGVWVKQYKEWWKWFFLRWETREMWTSNQKKINSALKENDGEAGGCGANSSSVFWVCYLLLCEFLAHAFKDIPRVWRKCFPKRPRAILLATTHSALTFLLLGNSFKTLDSHQIQISSNSFLTFKDKCL